MTHPRPIFIVGAGRSGTSVLTWAIGQHPNIHVVPETDWVTALASWAGGLYRIGMAQHPSGHFSRWNVSEELFLDELGIAVDGMIRRTFERRFPDRRRSLGAAMEQRGLAWFRSLDDPKTRWVNGTPSASGYAAALGRMFPEGRFINLVRDPDSVVTSWMGAPFRAPDVARTDDLLAYIYHTQNAGYLAHAAFGERAIRVLFEDLVADPAAEMARILAFLGEPDCADCLKPLERKINSSGAPSDAVQREFAGAQRSPLLRQMRTWYAAARDPGWRIAAPEAAAADLAGYLRNRVPLPA